jgi:DGQHR domain-containing protein
LTLSTGSPNTIRDKVTHESFDPARWWSSLGRRYRPKRSLAALARQHTNATLVVAVSGSYLELISDDLDELEDDELDRVRLIGPQAIDRLPERLRKCHLPYDDRLNDSESRYRGTRADFSQRALRHFADRVWPRSRRGSISEHLELINDSLAGLTPPEIPDRKQLSDEEIVDAIVAAWDRADGKSSRMLRVLRDEERIACEQGRFVRLFATARNGIVAGQNQPKHVALRAVRTIQGEGVDVYSFFIPGSLITEIADISRIHRDENDELEGFQRKEIRRHVNSIVEYLDQGTVLFPNSITLALSPEVEFKQARGREPEGTLETSQAGTLYIPQRSEGNRVAWIVDGQQRSLALAKTKNGNLSVPVVAFVAEDLETQREQFILVNKAKPLPTRLINELLPEVDTYLPRDLTARKIPSALCELLNRDPNSPFHGLIKRMSSQTSDRAVVVDNAIINMIKESIRAPNGALAPFKALGKGPSNTEGMYRTLVMFWSAVKETFPEAWGLPPANSRLMHSVGIRAMGELMDRIATRASVTPVPATHIAESLARIAPRCRWVEGVWEDIGLAWNEVEQTTRHQRALSQLLCHLDYAASAQGRLP